MRSIKSPSWISRLLGTDPVPVPPHVFALDERRVRYGRFAPEGRRLGFRAYDWRELPEDLFATGPLGGAMRDPGQLTAALRELTDGAEAPVEEGSLVLPDAWLRVTFTEVGDLPRSLSEREEVLRWKLRRLVPFRVEELRLSGIEVTPLAKQEEPRRMLLGFGVDLLLGQIEEAFAEAGVRIGQISNQSLSLMVAVADALRDVDLGAVVQVSPSGYSVACLLRGEPVLHRFKGMPALAGGPATESIVARDLRLTRVFLEEQISVPVGRVLLVCPEEHAEVWLDWLEQAFELPAFAVGREHLPAVEGESFAAEIHEVASLFGAAAKKVA